jgi:IMP dehydrogenase
MKLRSNTPALTYDDVLLVPAHSRCLPNEVDTSVRLGGLDLRIPILSSAMDTVTESTMAIALAEEGGLGVIHKNLSVEEQVRQVSEVKSKGLLVGAAVGIGESGLSRAHALVEAGVDLLCVDTAHGHSEGVLRAVSLARKAFPGMNILAGSVATREGAEAVAKAGANILKVGIGPGSICTTRVVSGVGFPQLSAIDEAFDFCFNNDVDIVADGGIKVSGDIAKAIGVGATVVMVGSLLSGTDESPGEVFEHGGRKYKTYRGMGSIDAMKAGSSDRYFQDNTKKLVAEGIKSRVPYKGSVRDIVYQLVGGLRSAMGYTGHPNLSTMIGNCEFVRITSSGIVESRPHSVEQVD